MGIFSVLLSGGKPTAEVLWAAGGMTVSKLLSRESEGVNSEGKPELKSVCVLVRSTGRQESDSRRGGHARSTYANMMVSRLNVSQHNINNESNLLAYSTGIRPPSVDGNGECQKMNECANGMKTVLEDKQLNEHMEENDEDVDPFYINTVRLRKEKKESLRVTVEITHPALRLPAYLTWTGK